MKETDPPSHWHTVQNQDAARALSDPNTRRILAPFLERERTISDVKCELGIDKNALLLRVRRLCRVGLLHITREEARAGRAIKYYQAVAPGFFVPYDEAPYATPEEWLLADYAGRERELAHATMQAGLQWGASSHRMGFGKRFFRRADGVLEADFAFAMQEEAALLEPEAPAVMSVFVYTHLDLKSAKELQAELLTVVRRFERVGEGRRYLLRLGLAPLVGNEH
ncbi:hypothetical protein ACFFLM_15380 [Deinococcus oregonensis]|uniref:ArsR family transcriptional regulator n=1 Tax=Deinococcus oregonensis TaxID=1805970 RepID=A0ABV6B0T1_9DEIO